MAKKVLGTSVEKRGGLARTYGLHQLQSCQTWLCSKSVRLAIGSFRRAVKQGLYQADWGASEPSNIGGMNLE